MNQVLIVRPDREQYTRLGEPLGIDVDIDLDDPWFSLPRGLGRPVPNFDGEPEPALIFETFGNQPVKSLTTGRAEARDPGPPDDHSTGTSRTSSSRNTRGCEVTVQSGLLQVNYSHLRRGQLKNGFVKVGDTIGTSGNTGRVPNGAQKACLKISVKHNHRWTRIEEFTEPIVVEAKLNGKPAGAPTVVPQGETCIRGLRLERYILTFEKGERGDFRGGENEVEVVVRRGQRELAKASRTVLVDWT